MSKILVRKLARVLTGDGNLSPSSPAMVLAWNPDLFPVGLSMTPPEHPTCLPPVCPRATRRAIFTVLSPGISPDRLWEGYSQCKNKQESQGSSER